jgi:hypothetical protein
LGEEQDMFIGGCQRDWDKLPDPAAPLIVGIDGGYVHKALQIVEDLEFALDLEENRQEQRKLLKAVREFGTYILPTDHSFRTRAIVTDTERPFRQPSLSQPSIRF